MWGNRGVCWGDMWFLLPRRGASERWPPPTRVCFLCVAKCFNLQSALRSNARDAGRYRYLHLRPTVTLGCCPCRDPCIRGIPSSVYPQPVHRYRFRRSVIAYCNHGFEHASNAVLSCACVGLWPSFPFPPSNVPIYPIRAYIVLQAP